MKPIYRIKIRHNKYMGVDVMLQEQCTVLWVFKIWLVVKIRRGIMDFFETSRIVNAWMNSHGEMAVVDLTNNRR